MKILILMTLLFAQLSYAGIEHAPPSFVVSNEKLVFVDFIKAHYDIVFDTSSKTATSTTTIFFRADEEGYPIFDSVTRPSDVKVNGISVDHALTTVPGNVSYVRYAKTKIGRGVHMMIVKTNIQNGVKYFGNTVSSGFFIKDLKDRNFLERYVVTNYEYDQYEMQFNVRVNGTSREHTVYANGEMVEVGPNHFQINFPRYYTASSLYFHLAPKNKFVTLNFNYTSINGTQIPVTIYSSFKLRNWRFKNKTIQVLRELENDYGPYPHPKLLIYGTKLRGGMEYVAATATSYVALGHELQHMYFAKGLMPADGNAGWMDEGIASWRDKGHQMHSRPNYFSFNLGKHNVYTRKTDKNSYEKGRSFVAYLDYQLKAAGKAGMKDFLRGYFAKRKFTLVTTEDFKNDLEAYANINFTADFVQYIYGGNPMENQGRSPAVEPLEDPNHPEYTEEEILSII
jgi:hypothetical protein